MSKAAKRSVFILIVLLVATLGYAVMTALDLKKTEGEVGRVTESLVQTQDKLKLEKQLHLQNTEKFKNEIQKVTGEKTKALGRINEVERLAEQQAEDLTAQVNEITMDRDTWKQRIETIRQERDQLMGKIDELTKKLEEKPEPEIVYVGKEPEAGPQTINASQAPLVSPEGKNVDEAYWADLLQQKASLEIDIQKLKEDLSAKSIAVVEAKQNNENLRMEVDTLEHKTEELEIEIQHKADMIDNISLELARTKNDKKFISDRVEKLNAENGTLRQQMKQLVSVKNALEKSIVRLTQEKDKIEGRLGRTETLIQSKIDEIWEIKDELDQSIRSAQTDPSTNEVELPPIIVSSGEQQTSFNTGETPSGFNGRVISVNAPNNFVIVDIGEDTGIRLGDSLSVYRDSKYIARLEVIQVRKDISAADLKDQWTKVKVGDVIR